MKRGKRNAIITASLIIGLIVLGIFLEYITLPPSAPSLAPPDIPLPTDCSNEQVSNSWEAIFYENSSNINIVKDNDTACKYFYAYKIKGEEAFILSNFVLFGEGILATQGNFTPIYLNAIQSGNFLDTQLILSLHSKLRSNPLSIENATAEFSQYLKINPGTWVEAIVSEYPNMIVYISNENQQTATGTISSNLFVQANYTMNQFLIFDTSCISNWTSINEQCKITETYNRWFNDTKRCLIETSRPSNQTLDCDYDNNGIIGNLSNIDLSNINLDFKINESGLNLSKTYTSTQNIKILDGSKLKVQSSWNFATPLNLRNVSIKKQPSSSNNGYLIINGIPASKTIYVDQKENSTNSVCVKNMKINSISEIDSDCNGTSETLLSCPGSGSGYTCTLSNNTFTISGLTNSAVEEFLRTDSGCEPFFNCTDWSECINDNQNRTCTDLNTCLPNRFENQSCSIFPPPPSCTEIWNCTNWQPSTCPKNETQTKSCTDINTCGTTDLKPNTTQSCEYKQNKMWIIIILVVVLIGLILIVAAIFVIYLIKNKKQEEESFYY